MFIYLYFSSAKVFSINALVMTVIEVQAAFRLCKVADSANKL